MPSNALASLVLRHHSMASVQLNMVHNVAQIVLVVFALDTGAQYTRC